MNIQTADAATADSVANASAAVSPAPMRRQSLPPVTQLPDELITVQEAARYLRVCQQTIYNLMAAGKLRAFYVGKKRRIPRAELLNYLGGAAAETALATSAGAAQSE